MTVAIQAESLSKAFQIGVETERPETLVAAALGVLKAPIKNFKRLRRLDTGRVVDSDANADFDESPDLYWALRNICFKINAGEVVGIIGRNGAGKSTLLKVLSKITKPTRGRAVIRGRISSLLEVGTGFHPELSGRENVYMNGTILGMTKRDIDRCFDEIVAFSGVETFLDTPIKRYSSGMQVRLAFAVAAHLEPEILVIDEVLAVGDAEFQRRCLGKMEDVAKSGRTVLFVSHNMAAVQNLCTRGILLQSGSVALDAPIAEVIEEYMRDASGNTHQKDLTDPELMRMGTGEAKLVFGEVECPTGGAAIPMGRDLTLRVELRSDTPMDDLVVGFMLFDACGTRVCGLHSGDTARQTFSTNSDGSAVVECQVSSPNLMPGIYHVNAYIQNGASGQFIDHVTHALSFDVLPEDVYKTGRTSSGAWTNLSTGGMAAIDSESDGEPGRRQVDLTPHCFPGCSIGPSRTDF